ncbi:phosphoribosylformylglycinamidine synthase [Desulfotalea psychrophila]|uniref:Phosphoribosylformylglycinamidine synthase n=1 Tax=Desulfotalea psychrophila (strain LSv54 / DSM 12343) TaxID=177439 RepID=Q6AQE0_DESPS|nr:phosphoribosylformylglycinamidine synthase [Desulfotalea psychrophila]CAG35433.1 probable phosphoribosylformylglycinamidine synthase [Desulfotalea psychrophila LSv54]
MGVSVTQLYRRIDESRAYCFNVESSSSLTPEELNCLRLILAEGFLLETVSFEPVLVGDRVVELGPRMNFATAWSSNMVSICQATGLGIISRVERSRRYLVPADVDTQEFIAAHHDRMTECHYPQPITTFETGIKPAEVYDVDLMSGGADALLNIPGISMDEWDRNLYYDYFVNQEGRNPSIVEIMDLNNANSEHSRHGFFKAKQVIDGEEQEGTLFDLVTDTLDAHPAGSIIAFKDNSSVIAGHSFSALVPESPGQSCPFVRRDVTYNPLLTAETHNFPTGVAPFPGAETGTGGRLRDTMATGQGSMFIAGTAGYCVGNLNIPGYELSWEKNYPCPTNLASALEIEIEASNGASDYGNKFGEPLIQGFTRSFDMRLENGERWGFLKPIMFTAGIGQMNDQHTVKSAEEKGMIIVQVGGPAYRVGFGGGAASSMLQGENESELDFDAVQRGDAEMEQKMSRVIRACNEMGEKSLIEIIHDQGCGGPANVIKELVEKSGGRVDIRKIQVGDPTMSVLEIYVAEYQERCGFLIRPENIEQFENICKREKVGCEILGEVTGDLRFVLFDSENGTTPVDIDLPVLLGDIPQKTFEDNRTKNTFSPLKLAADATIESSLHDVLRLVSVGSKRFLTNKVDRAVSGLIAQQQCVGPLQLPLSNVAVVAQSHFSKSGIASAIGEQSIKMLIDPAAGARMAVGEVLTNMVWAKIDDMEQIKCSANWMWAPKLAGEGAALYDAAKAMRDTMIEVGMAVDGGKDSLSMATMVGDEVVKSPRELVISTYAAMADLDKKVTPDLKHVDSELFFIDPSCGAARMGGTALAQVNGQLGDKSPDVEDGALLKKAFLAVQEMIDAGLISAGHDRSDGGLVTTMLEMAFAGNCGLKIELSGDVSAHDYLFNEELGMMIECVPGAEAEVEEILVAAGITPVALGFTTADKNISISYNGEQVLNREMQVLRSWWEETSYQLERLQVNVACAESEKEVIYDRKGPAYHLPFAPEPATAEVLAATDKPKIAILRDEGSNSDREMTAAFYSAGFEAWDVCMNDLLAGSVDLADFRGLAAVGGFSYADVPESAKGWAATIQFNPRLKEMFDTFYNRPDTFTFGICNGCQLFSLLGWVPQLGTSAEDQPRFAGNLSGRFESRWTTVKVQASTSIMLQGMEDLVFGIHVDHGEGRLLFPNADIMEHVKEHGMTPMVYVDDEGEATEQYPLNPNGSAEGLAGLCSADGRHLALMPHPERCFLPWQMHYLPEEMKELEVSPWFQMFKNAYDWCMSN